MAPTQKAIKDCLISTIESTWYSDERESLTVRLVRDKVEEKLKLGQGFLASEAWKGKCKKIIQDHVAKLQELPEPENEKPRSPSPAPAAKPVKQGKKRTSEAATSRAPPKKKQRKDDDSSELSEPPPEEADASDFDEAEGRNAPKSKKKAAPEPKLPVRRKSNSKAKADSDEDEDEDMDSDAAPKSAKKATPAKAKTPVKAKRPPKSKARLSGDDELSDAPKATKASATKPKAKRLSTKPKVDSDDEEEEARVVKNSSDEGSDSPKKKSPPKKKVVTPKKPVAKKPSKPKVDTDSESEEEKPDTPSKPKATSAGPADQFKKAPLVETAENKPAAQEDDESEMSEVLDEAPKHKRKRQPKSEASSSKKTKAPKAPRAKAAPVAKDLSPDEELIKTLQGQLKKCGIKTIFAFALKQYGDDSKAKIKHLQKELKDIGMTGRFSAERAREIKEMRELMADVDAIKAGEKNWGVESGKRSSRGGNSKGKSLREKNASADEDEEKASDAGDEEDGKQLRSKSESESPVPARKRPRADLAFLDDEDSDE